MTALSASQVSSGSQPEMDARRHVPELLQDHEEQTAHHPQRFTEDELCQTLWKNSVRRDRAVLPNTIFN